MKSYLEAARAHPSGAAMAVEASMHTRTTTPLAADIKELLSSFRGMTQMMNSMASRLEELEKHSRRSPGGARKRTPPKRPPGWGSKGLTYAVSDEELYCTGESAGSAMDSEADVRIARGKRSLTSHFDEERATDRPVEKKGRPDDVVLAADNALSESGAESETPAARSAHTQARPRQNTISQFFGPKSHAAAVTADARV